MNWLILKNDFKRNKVINFILILFMTFSSCFAASAVIMGIHTVSSISEMYKTAQPPHFLQMHKGNLDPKEVNDFISRDNEVVYHQVCRMIDIYGESIKLIKKDAAYDFSDCHIDIGLVK